MRCFVVGVVALVAALLIAPAAAQDKKASDDSAAADFKALSFENKLAVCLACHGEKGVSEAEGVPSLAGQPPNFMEFQLIFMRYGGRKNAAMAPYAQALTDDEIQKFGDYFAALPPPPGAPDNDAAETKAGATLDNGHCEICHLRTGQGDTPRLDGQREDYLIKSLHDYKDNLRFGRGLGAMNEIAVSLSDAEIRDLAHYFSVQTGH
jgi:cytochrome c553